MKWEELKNPLDSCKGDDMKYLVAGKIKLKEERTFEKEVEGKSENDAREKVYGLFGSSNKLKRTKVVIESVKKI